MRAARAARRGVVGGQRGSLPAVAAAPLTAWSLPRRRCRRGLAALAAGQQRPAETAARSAGVPDLHLDAQPAAAATFIALSHARTSIATAAEASRAAPPAALVAALAAVAGLLRIACATQGSSVQGTDRINWAEGTTARDVAAALLAEAALDLLAVVDAARASIETGGIEWTPRLLVVAASAGHAMLATARDIVSVSVGGGGGASEAVERARRALHTQRLELAPPQPRPHDDTYAASIIDWRGRGGTSTWLVRGGEPVPRGGGGSGAQRSRVAVDTASATDGPAALQLHRRAPNRPAETSVSPSAAHRTDGITDLEAGVGRLVRVAAQRLAAAVVEATPLLGGGPDAAGVEGLQGRVYVAPDTRQQQQPYTAMGLPDPPLQLLLLSLAELAEALSALSAVPGALTAPTDRVLIAAATHLATSRLLRATDVARTRDSSGGDSVRPTAALEPDSSRDSLPPVIAAARGPQGGPIAHGEPTSPVVHTGEEGGPGGSRAGKLRGLDAGAAATRSATAAAADAPSESSTSCRGRGVHSSADVVSLAAVSHATARTLRRRSDKAVALSPLLRTQVAMLASSMGAAAPCNDGESGGADGRAVAVASRHVSAPPSLPSVGGGLCPLAAAIAVCDSVAAAAVLEVAASAGPRAGGDTDAAALAAAAAAWDPPLSHGAEDFVCGGQPTAPLYAAVRAHARGWQLSVTIAAARLLARAPGVSAAYVRAVAPDAGAAAAPPFGTLCLLALHAVLARELTHRVADFCGAFPSDWFGRGAARGGAAAATSAAATSLSATARYDMEAAAAEIAALQRSTTRLDAAAMAGLVTPVLPSSQRRPRNAAVDTAASPLPNQRSSSSSTAAPTPDQPCGPAQQQASPLAVRIAAPSPTTDDATFAFFQCLAAASRSIGSDGSVVSVDGGGAGTAVAPWNLPPAPVPAVALALLHIMCVAAGGGSGTAGTLLVPAPGQASRLPLPAATAQQQSLVAQLSFGRLYYAPPPPPLSTGGGAHAIAASVRPAAGSGDAAPSPSPPRAAAAASSTAAAVPHDTGDDFPPARLLALITAFAPLTATDGHAAAAAAAAGLSSQSSPAASARALRLALAVSSAELTHWCAEAAVAAAVVGRSSAATEAAVLAALSDAGVGHRGAAVAMARRLAAKAPQHRLALLPTTAVIDAAWALCLQWHFHRGALLGLLAELQTRHAAWRAVARRTAALAPGTHSCTVGTASASPLQPPRGQPLFRAAWAAVKGALDAAGTSAVPLGGAALLRRIPPDPAWAEERRCYTEAGGAGPWQRGGAARGGAERGRLMPDAAAGVGSDDDGDRLVAASDDGSGGGSSSNAAFPREPPLHTDAPAPAFVTAAARARLGAVRASLASSQSPCPDLATEVVPADDDAAAAARSVTATAYDEDANGHVGCGLHAGAASTPRYDVAPLCAAVSALLLVAARQASQRAHGRLGELRRADEAVGAYAALAGRAPAALAAGAAPPPPPLLERSLAERGVGASLTRTAHWLARLPPPPGTDGDAAAADASFLRTDARALYGGVLRGVCLLPPSLSGSGGGRPLQSWAGAGGPLDDALIRLGAAVATGGDGGSDPSTWVEAWPPVGWGEGAGGAAMPHHNSDRRWRYSAVAACAPPALAMPLHRLALDLVAPWSDVAAAPTMLPHLGDARGAGTGGRLPPLQRMWWRALLGAHGWTIAPLPLAALRWEEVAEAGPQPEWRRGAAAPTYRLSSTPAEVLTWLAMHLPPPLGDPSAAPLDPSWTPGAVARPAWARLDAAAATVAAAAHGAARGGGGAADARRDGSDSGRLGVVA